MEFDPYDPLRRGIYTEQGTSFNDLTALARKLWPVKTQFELVRIGGEYDGGYLVPNDLSGIQVCFSPGVANTATFESDILSKYQIGSHLADYSVEQPPAGFIPKSFTKKFVGCFNDEMTMTLEHWVNSCEHIDQPGDFILQMDIEGAEYVTLLSTPIDVLLKFRIIVLEVHDAQAWENHKFFNIARNFFDKLLSYFHVVHNHPNNNDGITNIYGFATPRTFELTLLRKDRSASNGFCSTFPHPLDRKNMLHMKDAVLPDGWFSSKAVENKKVYPGVLICIPQGGLNATLCSIGRCFIYAKKTNRKLCVDTTRQGVFFDDFWRYFRPRENSELFQFVLNYGEIDTLSTFPPEIQGRVSTFDLNYSAEKNMFVDKLSSMPVTFDFSQYYPAPVLVHAQGWQGNGLYSFELISHLKLTDKAKYDVLHRITQLPRGYSAIHIRNTDSTTDYRTFIDSIKEQINGKAVLICSDSLDAINYAQANLTNSKILRLSGFSNHERPLHLEMAPSDAEQYNRNIEAIADLLALGLADKLYFTNVIQTARPSGFSLLANELHQQKGLIISLLT